MIKNYMDVFLASEAEAKAALRELLLETNNYPTYEDIAKLILKIISVEKFEYDFETPRLDPNRLVQVDFGEYQGTLLFVTAPVGYQPSVFYTMIVDYGSCSGCDTLQAALWPPGENNENLLFDLARNMLATMHKVGGTLY